MLIRSAKPNDLRESDITDENIYAQRRLFLKQSLSMASMLAAAGLAPQMALASINQFADKIKSAAKTMSVDEESNSWDEITGYNNFYELGTGKGDPVKNASALQTDPWSVEVSGHCAKPGNYNLEDLLKPAEFEERIYRFRCVEAWSMVIPWVGVSLASMLQRFEPEGNAKYVAFETLYNKDRPLPGQSYPVLDWPYREGLRMDEAMNPLAFMAVGIYGKPLPNQNGAPMRLVVPWKYGFKSIKSIVKIHFSETRPDTSWNLSAPREYGFYSNVNPEVSHPRWSQARERRIGEFFKRDTLMFNGYEEEVAALYTDMNLRRNF